MKILDKIRAINAPLDTGSAALIVSGIPRSGTSLMCRLLDEHENTVVVNEPKSVVKQRTASDFGVQLSRYYGLTRKTVLAGRPIENKVDERGLIEDTWKNNTRSLHRPKYRDDRFVLCTKNTLVYLAHLDEIRAAMPQARIVLCVRNPIDCIASWKTTFDHLKDPPGSQYQGLPSWQKRIRYWLDLAEQIRKSTVYDFLVPYEELTANSVQMLETLTQGLAVGARSSAGEGSIKPRSKADQLSPEERHEIEKLCVPVYAALNNHSAASVQAQ